MNLSAARRHHRWYERLLLSRAFILLVGWLLTVFAPYILFWSWNALWHPDPGQSTALLVVSSAYVLVSLAIFKIRTLYPGGRTANYIAPITIIGYGFFFLLTFLSFTTVSRYLLLVSSACALPWAYIQYLLTYKHTRLKLAVILGGEYTRRVLSLPFIHAHLLETLSLENTRYDGIVADFEQIDAPTQKFLTQCVLNGTAIYNAKSIYESLTGRVNITHMSENLMGSMLPSPLYNAIKRCMDIVIILLTLPMTIVISLVTAIAIKLESPGPIFFTQIRIGQGNRPFTLYKFRSMHFDRQATTQFTEKNDPRITRIGRFIRKLRIDELPQLINVLKGDMSLIGPRPEQAVFIKEYERNVAFYSYRHIVKPGITGWAQIMHGYAASYDETKIKIEYDFFYIKHCSFSLDCIIMLLTIRIMLTGFGAR